jgi:methyl-accepting chemotaxis protein
VGRAELDAKLAVAHGKLEKKFLEGGAVLIAISDILKRLIASLDALTGVLDADASNATMERILSTAKELAELPTLEHARLKGFEKLKTACQKMQSNVEDMRETMRYLRTFAITVKITGAGIAEFAGFADEIRERIQSGAQEVDRFGDQLSAMAAQLATATQFSARISREYGDVVPGVVRDLERDAGVIADHHRKLSGIANDVKSLARAIQSKIAQVLSALQIGDITRQRLEHVRSSFEFLDEFKASAEGAALSEEMNEALDSVIDRLAAAQTESMVDDFERDCRKIMQLMQSFVDDAHSIMSLRETMHQSGDRAGNNFLATLERGVAAATGLVSNVAETSANANLVAQSTGETAHSLVDGISIIRGIKTDIHYMALNSNLRCSKLGDEGRSVNVVSAELRVFAEKLEEPANNVVDELQHFESAAVAFSQCAEATGSDLSLPLREALDDIRAMSKRMDESIALFEHEGQEVFAKVSAALSTLDFESELGDVLRDCVAVARDLGAQSYSDASVLGSSADGLSARIYKIYTMASERDLHREIMPINEMADEPVAKAPMTDEDLFDDALF